ncbi:hypothetical protein [Aliarcobacter butzleri]|uniref:hypothetical protein n=1 Tax=Aliarcobacter butzleri TaxID=28197 RepID=UPI001269F459|nr:hypothetical protein [Aliarcobacter butzleri]
MGLSTDARFEFENGALDLVALKEKVENSKELEYEKDFLSNLIDIKVGCINSFSNENFYLETQDIFFNLIQSCLLDETGVTVEVECIDSDSSQTYIITKENIFEK